MKLCLINKHINQPPFTYTKKHFRRTITEERKRRNSIRKEVTRGWKERRKQSQTNKSLYNFWLWPQSTHCPALPAWSSIPELTAAPAHGHSTVWHLHFSGGGIQVQRSYDVTWLLICVVHKSECFLVSMPSVENFHSLLSLHCFWFQTWLSFMESLLYTRCFEYLLFSFSRH